MALKLDILANTRQFVTEMKKSGASVEDISDALDDMAKDGVDAGNKLERSFKDIAKEAKTTDTAVEKVGKDGFSHASQASGEFKAEALSNFSEVTSSFDGSMSSIQDLAQGTLGGLASTDLPGIGLAAGLAAGAVGLIGAEFVQRQEQADELKKRISEMYLQAAEDGIAYLDTATIIGDAQDLIFNPDRADELSRVMDTQRLTGLDLSTIYKANAGDLDSIATVQAAIAGEIDTQIQKNTEAGEAANYSRELQDVEDHWNDVETATDEAITKTKQAQDAAIALQDETAKKAATVRTDLENLWKTPVPGTVKLTVDDSAVKAWRPPMVKVPAILTRINALGQEI